MSEVFTVCKSAIDMGNRNSTISALAGECLFRLARLEEAAEFLAQAIKDPANANAHRIYARILFASGDRERAVENCSKSLEIDPSSFHGWADLSIYTEAMGDLIGSLSAAERAQELATGDERMKQRIVRLNKLIRS